MRLLFITTMLSIFGGASARADMATAFADDTCREHRWGVASSTMLVLSDPACLAKFNAASSPSPWAYPSLSACIAGLAANPANAPLLQATLNGQPYLTVVCSSSSYPTSAAPPSSTVAAVPGGGVTSDQVTLAGDQAALASAAAAQDSAKATLDLATAQSTAGDAYIKLGVAMMANPAVVPAGLALIAAGTALKASAAAKTAEGQAALVIANQQLSDAQAKLAKDQASQLAAANHETTAPVNSQTKGASSIAAVNTASVVRTLAVQFGFTSYETCMEDLGGRLQQAHAAATLPGDHDADSYCRSHFPAYGNGGSELSNLSVTFTFSSEAECSQATGTGMRFAEGQTIPPSDVALPTYCHQLFSGAPTVENPAPQPAPATEISRLGGV